MQGIPGKDGASGKTTYFHIKYSSIQNPTTSSQITETPSAYIGTYVDYTEADSTDPKKYTWARFQGIQGEDGLPGVNGENGQTSYLHIKYSDNGGLSFTSNNGEDTGDYIGQYTDFNKKDSDKPGDYTWSRIKGESGSSGTDATAGEYYEYRYAKNGSTSTPPTLNVSATNPDGWSKVMPKPGALEYVWCTMAKKSGIADRTVFNLPVNLSDYTSIADVSGNGYNGVLGDGAKVTKVGNTRCVLDLSSNAECRIPYDLPFGESFTLCFMMSTSEKMIKWMLNGYNGRDYVEKSLSVEPYSWINLAFRFNDRTVTVFVNGNQVQTGSVNEAVVGFALYDDNIFGSEAYFDNIRLLRGALAVEDINKVITGEVDTLVQNWSTPVRINPYDGIDGKDGVGVTLTDVEYANSSSNSTAPTSGWQTTAPAWENGKYIWSRTKVVYTDGSTNYTKAACITGGVGETGSAGVGVSSIVEQYYLSSSYSTQTGGSWSTTRPAWKDDWYIWTRSVITYTNGTSTTTSPICVTGGKGETGDKGDPGEKGDSPATVFRGVYSNSSTYYGTKYRLDVVKYNGVYYVARIDAGTFSGKAPTDTSKWNTFGAQFDSVATQLLLAEFANIGNLILKNNCLISQKGTVNGVASTDYTNANFVPNIMLDGANGQSVINGSLRSPFAFYDGSWYVGSDVSSDAERYDNLVLPISQSGGWETALSFPWTNKCNGRKITIVNYKWGNTISQGTFSLTAPSGKYFFENGILKSKISFSREVIELLGYGDNNTFFGWIVIGRHDIGTTGKYGEVQKVMYAGEVRGSNSSAWFYKKFSFDGTSMSVSRLGEGYYRVYFGSSFSSEDDYTVIMTGSMVGSSSNASMVYACLVDRTTSYFTVRLADDASTNDGGFIFQVISMRFSWT